MSRYVQTPPPQTVDADRDLLDVVRWAAEEFQKLSTASDLAQDLEVVGEEPEVLVEGMVRYFSAGGFDPGYGPGAYCYSNNYGVFEWRPMFTV